MVFLQYVNPERYNTLWYIHTKKYLTGAYHYPKTPTDSLNLISTYRTPVINTITQDGGGKQQGTNVQFTQEKGTDQQRKSISGIDRNTRDNVTFYYCQCPGHILSLCPNEANIQTFQVNLHQSEVLIPISWVLLDFGSSIISISNYGLVHTIWDTNVTTTVHTNGGSKNYTQTASLHLLPLDDHLNSTYLANLISLSEVESNYQVTMDTSVESVFNVHINDYTIDRILKFGPGLY